MGKPQPTSSLDRSEIDKFDELAEQWWNPEGPMRPLHRLNPVRLGYIRDRVCAAFDRDVRSLRPLAGLRVLDVGCGCGLLTEPMARMGAAVTGIDPSERNIEVARRHAQTAEIGAGLRYLRAEAGSMRKGSGAGDALYDLVTCLEVIEHSPDPAALLADLASLVADGGLLVLSTLNRTPRAFLEAIVGAEYLLGWLPRGTHDWRRFLKPSEVARWLRRAGLDVQDIQGFDYDAGRGTFGLSRDRTVNYILTAARV
ncbi:MAG: bifunctional 2-polyprenyl-6-hydroxyphenol methylase/3-demethylubiquinol 3-O-methyltransferase UbiG [Geminicoccaceae bacterium]|nr:bifunctional 2-polyprenyl-6-hydroxyphenol methylase/3-demethylubiquinol 3-O-methyltransferase UbiG [Geminicoccaceae bacterium]